jgi:hypothetical protein
MKAPLMKLRMAAYKDDDRAGLADGEERWIAELVDFDLIGESGTREGAVRNLVAAVVAEFGYALRDGRKPFDGLRRREIPARSREYDAGRVFELPEDVKLPPPWMIEAMELASHPT